MDHDIYNVGSNQEIKIAGLAELIRDIVGFDGDIIWDKTKPDGTPKKILDSSKINDLGWNSKIDLLDGVKSTYDWYLKNYLKIN